MKRPPLQIGSLTIPFPVGLAPMSRITNDAARTITRDFGCGFTFTEVVTANGLVYGSEHTRDFLTVSPSDHPIAAHLYGSDPDILTEAARIITLMDTFDWIDLNAGCPVPRIVNRGAGAALLEDPEKIRRILVSMTGATHLPVTVKIRTGIRADAPTYPDVARAAQDGGASAVILHARPASVRHRGPADWNALTHLKKICTLPIIGNGGITSAADAERMFRETGVDGVLIGRAAIGTPWIFEQCMQRFSGEKERIPDRSTIYRGVEAHFQRLLQTLQRRGSESSRLSSEEAAIRSLLPHLRVTLRTMDAGADVRRQLSTLRTEKALFDTLKQALQPEP